MMEDHDDFAFEPVRGVPAELPAGERILWQGAPSWTQLAISAFHVRKVAIYFLVIAAWQMYTAETGRFDGLPWLALAGGLSIAILSGLAWFYARSTVYTLTDKRVLIRSGLALPVTLNLPLSLIDGAALRRHRGGGSIALSVAKPNRVAWLVVWPSVRPWTFNNPEPMLRGLADAETVVPLITGALRQSGPSRPAPARQAKEAGMPVGAAAGAAV